MDTRLEKPKMNPAEKLLVVPLFSKSDFTAGMPEELKPLLKKRQERKDFKASAGSTVILYPDTENLPGKILLAGFGKKAKLNDKVVRECAAMAVKSAKSLKTGEMAVMLPDRLIKSARTLGEGLGLGNYNPAKYQTGKKQKQNEKGDIKIIKFLSPKANKNFIQQLREGLETADAVNCVRDLVNAPPALKSVNYMADKAAEIARHNGYKLTVLDLAQIKKLKMGGIAGVNRGSTIGAKLVMLEHRPWGTPKKPVVIAGKGIIFDSGGYNLKPSGAMANMNLDMAGAAAVMGTFMLLKKLKIRQHVVGIFALTENLIDANAQKPSDIITTYDGKTVEITNTDAEGRLILADTVSYAIKKYQPRYLVDLATLTGACMVALGERYAGLFSNNRFLNDTLKKAGDETDELVWPLPLHPDYAAKMKSKIADLKNSEEGAYAGASKGAAFIQYFVGKTPWAHLDIAGPAHVKDPKKYETAMGTGYGVRLLVQFLRKL
jgi:leucyl aminopeptidase